MIKGKTLTKEVFLKLLSENPTYQQSLRLIESFDKCDPVYLDVKTPIDDKLRKQLRMLGYEKFYTHQALAYDAAMQGEDVVVLTSTGSGKSLCYNLPVFQTCRTEPAARALYLFPTKALGQDQQYKLHELAEPLGINCSTYDGDTPPRERSLIRANSHILLTNPDMLHIGILPHHEKWTSFFKSLRWIVIDEMHTYSGIFGSHMACILKRLLRLCAWHRSDPKIIACSATIANPVELFKNLTGRVPTLIDQDGAPQAARHIILWAPKREKREEKHSFAEVSTNLLTSQLLAMCCAKGIPSLAFCKARSTTELVLRATRNYLRDAGLSQELVEGYRGGYRTEERREIHRSFVEGRIKGLATTNAMELGIDIESLDVAILNGYPGSISSFRQQVGRVGRKDRDGFAVMLAQADPLEQYLVRYPTLLLEASPESVAINPNNPYVLGEQILCAAHERALSLTELGMFGSEAIDLAEKYENDGFLDFRRGCFYYGQERSPAHKVNIRGLGEQSMTLYLHDTMLGTMERWRALQSAHPGAVYMHRGKSYVVQDLDLGHASIYLAEHEENYYTRALMHSTVEPGLIISHKEYGLSKVSLTKVTLTNYVVAYQKISNESHSVIGVIDLEVPSTQFDTIAVRVDLPVKGDYTDTLACGVHGIKHVLLATAPLFAGCEKNNLRSSWYVLFADSLSPSVFVFDNLPGGIGLSEKLYDQFPRWVRSALDLLESCPCEEGCPGCLMSSRCEIGNQNLDKPVTVSLLKEVIQSLVDV